MRSHCYLLPPRPSQTPSPADAQLSLLAKGAAHSHRCPTSTSPLLPGVQGAPHCMAILEEYMHQLGDNATAKLLYRHPSVFVQHPALSLEQTPSIFSSWDHRQFTTEIRFSLDVCHGWITWSTYGLAAPHPPAHSSPFHLAEVSQLS